MHLQSSFESGRYSSSYIAVGLRTCPSTLSNDVRAPWSRFVMVADDDDDDDDDNADVAVS
jgi:hypothetical protein